MTNLRPNIFALLVGSLALTFYGLVILFSATQPFEHHLQFFSKQLIWLGIAFFGFLFITFIRLEKLTPYAWGICILTLIILISVLVFGLRINGTRRWLNFGPLRVQASEPAKLGYILTLAYYLSRYQTAARTFLKGFVLPCGIIGIFCLLVLVEPDFGTAFLFGIVGLFLLFLNGVRFLFLIPTFLSAGTLFAIAVYLDPIRLRRITAFLDVEANRLTGAYQLWQGLIGFCTGGLTGTGLGQGRQQHFFLPEAHTDFIFSILGEELGLIHVFIVILCFAILAYNGLKIIQKTASPFLFFVASGALAFLTFQAFLNMGVVTGLLPTKGLSLPFISYGGSNLFTNFCLVGLLTNIALANSRILPSLAQRDL